MTTYNKSTLATYFQTNDVPTGTDYSNLIDSQVNIVETSAQAMGGPLSTPELITSRVSAGNANITGSLSIAGTISAVGTYVNTLSVAVSISAASVYTNVLSCASAVATGTVSAASVYAGTKIINTVATISAAGTTQTTGSLCSASICRLAGVTDGSTTGFTLMANRTGWNQKLYGANASANLWPPTGGTINALAANAAFPLATNTLYDVVHLAASAYAVK